MLLEMVVTGVDRSGLQEKDSPLMGVEHISMGN